MKDPTPQAVHTADVTAPNTEAAAYEPAAHVVQARVPVASALYAPAAHWRHDGADVYVPAWHVEHTADVYAPNTELKDPAAQDVHASVPEVREL